MIHLRNLLARHEIHVANYYFRRGAYLAAVNRGRYVVENFQQTPAVPDGLAVMAQGYLLLGMDDLAQDAHRHPGAQLSRPPFPGQERRVRHGVTPGRAAAAP
jgi:outer membrane assembly lipoprotein YfiO